MKIAGFDWDDGNWPKCGKHGVSRGEIEEAFTGGPAVLADPFPEEARMRAIGKSAAGRYVLVVCMLREIVGEARASELLLTGRILGADEALAWGLVSSLHPPADLLNAAHALADRIAANDPLATQHTKRAIRAPREHHPAIELELQAELFESPEKFRRMGEFLEKRSTR